MLDVAVVGAGAIAHQGYLPAIRELPNANLRWVVDLEKSRARRLASEFEADGHATDYRDILDRTDIVVISTPPSSHGEIATACFEHGVHVLVEKPIATTSAKVTELVSLSNEADVHYAVSRQQREAPACRMTRQFVENGSLGSIERVYVQFGDTTPWPFASDYRVQKSRSGGGVLMDKGPHILDAVLWMFGTDYTVSRYQDDSFGGLEANAWLEMTFEHTNSTGIFEITGAREVENTLVVVGETGKLVVDPGGSTGTLTDFESGLTLDLDPYEDMPNNYLLRVGKQTQRFVDAVETGQSSYVPAGTGVDVLELIEDCYETREQISQPWEAVGTSQPVIERSRTDIDWEVA